MAAVKAMTMQNDGLDRVRDQQEAPFFNKVDELSQRIQSLEDMVAQLKTLDASLQELQNIFFSYVRNIREGVVLIQDEMIVWANQAACSILGYALDEVINTSAVQMAHPKYRQQLAARFAMVQAGDEIPPGVAWPVISKTREIRHIKPFSYKVTYRRRPALMAFFYDVTDEKKLQDDLQMRAEMMDAVSDSVFLIEMNGKIVYVNRAACESLGYSRDELSGMNVVDINPPEKRGQASIRLKQVSSHKESRFRTIHICKDGSRLPVVVRIKVIKWADRDYVLGVVREVAEEGEIDM